MKKTVSGGGVVINSRGEVLVVLQWGKSWSLPKGHVEPGESPLDAALREIDEESGLQKINCIKSLGSYSRFKLNKDGGDDTTEHKTIHMFLFSSDPTELSPKDPHVTEARWVKQEEVTQLLTHPKDKQFFQSLHL